MLRLQKGRKCRNINLSPRAAAPTPSPPPHPHPHPPHRPPRLPQNTEEGRIKSKRGRKQKENVCVVVCVSVRLCVCGLCVCPPLHPHWLQTTAGEKTDLLQLCEWAERVSEKNRWRRRRQWGGGASLQGPRARKNKVCSEGTWLLLTLRLPTKPIGFPLNTAAESENHRQQSLDCCVTCSPSRSCDSGLFLLFTITSSTSHNYLFYFHHQLWTSVSANLHKSLHLSVILLYNIIHVWTNIKTNVSVTAVSLLMQNSNDHAMFLTVK